MRGLALVALILVLLGWLAVARPTQGAPLLQLPWPNGYQHRINSGGYSYNCGGHTGSNAYAIDFEFLTAGEYVAATSTGTISIASKGYNNGAGNYLEIDHGYGFKSRYLHLRSEADGGPWPPALTVGVKVLQGQAIAYSGNTGGVPPHLHFDAKLNGNAYMPEPMSGVSGFGPVTPGGEPTGFGLCPGASSSPWVSRSPLGRDATNDGCPDVFAQESASPNYWLRRYLGNCAGGLGNYVRVNTQWNPASNGIEGLGPTLWNSSDNPSEACADIIARENTGGHLRRYNGNCSGTYPSYTPFGSGWQKSGLDPVLTAGDLTGDGCTDVMARETATNIMRLYYGVKSGGTCTGDLGTVGNLGGGWNSDLANIAAVGDVYDDPNNSNDSGCFDVVAMQTYDFRLRVYPGLCNGALGNAIAIGSGWDPGSLGPILGPGDFDGDGCGDLLVRERTQSQALRLYRGNCNGTFQNPEGLGSGWSPSSLPVLMPR